MKDIVVIGGKKFVLGFQIAGISKAFQLSKEQPDRTVRELMNNPEIGLIIISEKSLEKVSEQLREDMLQSIQPVFMVVSDKGSNDDLRKLIKKSIGVDIWDKE